MGFVFGIVIILGYSVFGERKMGGGGEEGKRSVGVYIISPLLPLDCWHICIEM